MNFIKLIRAALLISALLLSCTAHAQATFNLMTGWNLLGNSSAAPINVATTFGDSSKITTVWKWNKTSSKWAFYTPAMSSADLATYTTSKGYDVLTSIASKEGFWVNAASTAAISGPAATGVTLAESDLQVGWNLVGSADSKTPAELNQSLSSSLATAGKGIVTTWAWDAPTSKWKFYAPSLATQGGTVLTDYIGGKGYLPFTTSLSTTDGYWVNVGAVTPIVGPTTRIKNAIHYNYAKIGYYSDQLTSGQDDVVMHGMIDRFKQHGYTGVMFEITVGVSNEGNLQNDLKYDRMLSLMDYAKSVGLGVAVLPNWTLNGGNASYIGYVKGGGIVPPEFKMTNFFKAVDDYFYEYAIKFNNHNVDLIQIANQSEDFFASQYFENWRNIILNIRSRFGGAISYTDMSANKFKERTIDSISIWPLLDAMTIWSRHQVSETPIYDVDAINSAYYSNLSSVSLIDEIVSASRKYKLPIILIANFFSEDNSLDGGWDPTPEQLRSVPLRTNPTLQALAYQSILHIISNNLNSAIASVVIGNYEPWTLSYFTDPIYGSWKYFDMTLFPDESEAVIAKYLADPSGFKVSNVTKASPINDVIFSKNGTNIIYLGGGYDEVHGGTGNDRIVVSPLIAGDNLTITFSEWVSNIGTDSVTVSINGNIVGTVNLTSDATQLTANPGGYWVNSQSLAIPITRSATLPRINITCSCNHGFVQASDIKYGITIDSKSASHIYPPLNGNNNWLQDGDVMTYNLAAIVVPSGSMGTFTYIDGGDGLDNIEFDPPQSSANFTIQKSGAYTFVTDTRGIFPQLKLINVEQIEFSDINLPVQ